MSLKQASSDVLRCIIKYLDDDHVIELSKQFDKIRYDKILKRKY